MDATAAAAIGWSDVAVLAGVLALVGVAALAALWPKPPGEAPADPPR